MAKKGQKGKGKGKGKGKEKENAVEITEEEENGKGKGKKKVRGRRMKWNAPEFYCKAAGCGQLISESVEKEYFIACCCSKLCLDHHQEEEKLRVEREEKKRKKEQRIMQRKQKREAERLRLIEQERLGEAHRKRQEEEDEQERDKERYTEYLAAMEAFRPPTISESLQQQERILQTIIDRAAAKEGDVKGEREHLEVSMAITYVDMLRQNMLDKRDLIRAMKSSGYCERQKGFTGCSVVTLTQDLVQDRDDFGQRSKYYNWGQLLQCRAKTANRYGYLPTALNTKDIWTTSEKVTLQCEPIGNTQKADAGGIPEYVLVDCRVEFPRLLELDHATEVFMIDTGDNIEGDCVAVPVRHCDMSFSEAWKRNADGWIWLPALPTEADCREAVLLSTEWWALLRYEVDEQVTQYFRFKDFLEGSLRTFILPLPSESCVRVLVTTNSALVIDEVNRAERRRTLGFDRDLNSLSKLLSHYMLTPMHGEWRQTLADESEEIDRQAVQTLRASLHESFGEAGKEVSSETQDQANEMRNEEIENAEKSILPSLSALGRSQEMVESLLESMSECERCPGDERGNSVLLGSSDSLRRSGAYLCPPELDDEEDEKDEESGEESEQESEEGERDIGKSNEKVHRDEVEEKLTEDCTTLPLFPHQRRTVKWMQSREMQTESELLTIPQVRKYFDKYVYFTGLENQTLSSTAEVLHARMPRGGVVAHSVGAGKTVIAAALMAQTDAGLKGQDGRKQGTNLCFVPDHIAVQWKTEIQRFAPQLRVCLGYRPEQLDQESENWSSELSRLDNYDAIIVPYSVLEKKDVQEVFRKGGDWFRIFMDEPQEAAMKQDMFQFLIEEVKATFRWSLTATPWPLTRIMESVWGQSIVSPYDQVLRSRFLRYCARRDPPGECLPVPQLIVNMEPVQLTWQESSIVTMAQMTDDLQRAIRLCSFLYNADEEGEVQTDQGDVGSSSSSSSQQGSEVADESDIARVRRVYTLDEWVNMHRGGHLENLVTLVAQANKLQSEIDKQSAVDFEKRRERDQEKSKEIDVELQTAFEEFLSLCKNVLSPLEFGSLPKTYSLEAMSVVKQILKEMKGDVKKLMLKWRKEHHQERHERWLKANPDIAEELRALAKMTAKEREDYKRKERNRRKRPKGLKDEELERYIEKEERERERRREPMPTDEDWEPENEMEVEIKELSLRLRSVEEFRRRIERIAAGSSKGGGDRMFTAGVDAGLIRDLNEVESEIAKHNRLLGFLDNVERTLRDPEVECAVCMEELQGLQVTIFPCFHSFCTQCVIAVFRMRNTATCPLCRWNVTRRECCAFTLGVSAKEQKGIIEEMNEKPGKEKEKEKGEGKEEGKGSAEDSCKRDEIMSTTRFGSKIQAVLMKALSILKDTDDKIIVFAQWSELLDDIHTALDSSGVRTMVLSNNMSRRVQQLHDFRHDPQQRVLLLSLEHQASGINLDMANHVFIVHPYTPSNALSAAVVSLHDAQMFEKQAVGRVHRYPQRKDVHLYRFYAVSTVEEELYNLWGWI